MLKMVIRMDGDKINIEKNTVWREYTRQLTTRLSKWAFPPQGRCLRLLGISGQWARQRLRTVWENCQYPEKAGMVYG